MRLETDYLVTNRELFMSIILQNCSDDSEIEIEGKLPVEFKKAIEAYLGPEKNKYIVNKQSREILNYIFVEKDNEINNHLLGLHFYSNSELMFQGFHFYDHDRESQSGRILFFHEAVPESLLQDLLDSNAMKADE